MIDNTNLKRGGEALRESQLRYKAVVEDQTEYINRYLANGTMTFVNEAYCRLLNKKAEELIGENWMDLFPEKKQEIVRKRLFSLTPKNPVSTYEYKKVLPNGDIRWEEWTYRAFFNENNEIKEFQSVGHDITERKKAEQLLVKERNRAEFFNDLLSHDINNLNHGIFSYLHMMIDSQKFPEKFKKWIKTSLHLSEEISALIAKVRILSEIEYENVELKSINFKKYLQNSIETVKINFSKKKIIDINFNMEDDVVVRANELLGTVVYNILNNGIKHNPKKEAKIEIDYSYSKYTRFYRFEFKDDGPGIEDNFKDKIFNRMERAGANKNVHGFGLGLTLVKNIIERFGGKIWVEDRILGNYKQGSNFVILLPRGD